MMYNSPETGTLYAALSKAQGAYKTLVPTQQAPGGIFASLSDLLIAVREALSTNGLAFYQYIELIDAGDGASILWTRIGHESGQFISSGCRTIIYPTLRETTNALEGYKRVHASLLLGIAPSPHDPLMFDDNGTEQLEKKIVEDIRHPDRKVVSGHLDKITKDQYTDLMHELEGYPQVAKGILKFYNITALADIPKSEFYTAQDRIRRIKKTHEEYVSTQ